MPEADRTTSAATVEIEVGDKTLAMLTQIAKLRDCTLNAALEEAIREFDPKK